MPNRQQPMLCAVMESGHRLSAASADAGHAGNWGMVAAGAFVAVGGGALFFFLDAAAAGTVWEITMSLLLFLMAVGILRHAVGPRDP